MKVEIKNSAIEPASIHSLLEYFESLGDSPKWDYNGLKVELDPTIDFKGNDALIRWTDIEEGFNDKLLVNSLEEFKSNFRLLNA
jgi:hypothetical protein